MAYIYGRIKSVSERKTHDGQNAVTLRVMTDGHHLVDVRVDDVKGSVQINRWVSLYGSFSGEGGRRFFHASMLALPRFSQFKESERQWKPYEVGGTVVNVSASTDSGWRHGVLRTKDGAEVRIVGYGIGKDVKEGDELSFLGEYYQDGRFGEQFWVDGTKGVSMEESVGAAVSGPQETVRTGEVVSIPVSRPDGTKELNVKTDSGYERFVGFLPDVEIGMTLEAGGTLLNRNGRPVFDISSYKVTSTTRRHEVAGELMSAVQGLTLDDAMKIYDTFGDDSMRILEADARTVGRVRGLSTRTMSDVMRAMRPRSDFRKVYAALEPLGIDENGARAIFNVFGRQGVKIRRNPYVIVGRVEGATFEDADRIARAAGLPADGRQRLETCVLDTVDRSVKSGSVCMDMDALVSGVSRRLSITEETVRGEIERMLKENRAKIRRTEDMVYRADLYRAERRVAESLIDLSTNNRSRRNIFSRPVRFGEIERKVSSMVGFDVKYDKSQRDAVEMVATNRISIITGGPGTGKTLTTNAVIAELEAEGRQVLLACPTGRGAKRTSEATHRDASTLHRLLEYKDGAFTRGADNPLEGGALIIDESSMVDIQLMESLLYAVPKSMKVVFVGDVDQLPSVGPGTVFRDMIESGRFPVSVLTTTHRQAKGSAIVDAAKRINEGLAPEYGDSDGSDFVMIRTASKEETHDTVVRLVGDGEIQVRYGFKEGDVQVLTAVRKDGNSIGATVLNRDLRPFRLESRPHVGPFFQGDRVIQTANDYEKGVVNGDMGVVREVSELDGTMTVSFDGVPEPVVYKREELPGLDLAYAITTHKSQGSEFPCVVIPVWESPEDRMMDKNLLYTAVTRGKKKVVLVGSEEAVEKIVSRRSDEKRMSLLIGRLTGSITDKQRIREHRDEDAPEKITQERRRRKPAAPATQEREKPSDSVSFSERKGKAADNAETAGTDDRSAGREDGRREDRNVRRVFERNIMDFSAKIRATVRKDGRLGEPYRPKNIMYVMTAHPTKKDTVLLETAHSAMRTMLAQGVPFKMAADLSSGRVLDTDDGRKAYDVFSGAVVRCLDDLSERAEVPAVVTGTDPVAEVKAELGGRDDVQVMTDRDFVRLICDKGILAETVMEMLKVAGRVSGPVSLDGGNYCLVERHPVRKDVILIQKCDTASVRESVASYPKKEADNMAYGYGFHKEDGTFMAYSILKGNVVPVVNYEERLKEILATKEHQDIRDDIRRMLQEVVVEVRHESKEGRHR